MFDLTEDFMITSFRGGKMIATTIRRMIQNIMRAAEVGVLYNLPPKAIVKIHKMVFGTCDPDILATMAPKETK